MPHDTIPGRLLRNAGVLAGRPAYSAKVGGAYQPTNWEEYAAEVRRVGRALIALGLPPGGHVGLFGFNRPEWVITCLAAMSVGGAGVGVYSTSSAAEVAYILSHSEAEVVLAESPAHVERVLARRNELPCLRRIVTMRGCPPLDDPLVLPWEGLLASAGAVEEAEFDRRLAALTGETTAALIYTSGTTGSPKGVVLTHDNLTWTADAARGLFPLGPDDRILSYLPLSHIAEQMYAMYVAITFGFPVAFAESLDSVRANLAEVRPTLLFGVPRVWDKFAAGVAERLSAAKGMKARLAHWAMEAASEVVSRHNSGRRAGPGLAVQYRLARRVFHRRVKRALGLDCCTVAVTGAAPADPAVLEFLAGLDLPVYEVYGLSETSGPATWNHPGRARFGTVGPPYPGVEVRLADDGEVMLKGGNVFTGYYRDPEATGAAFRDGWFLTGDLGSIDEEGFLSIIGRKKELIVTAGGKNIAPEPLETALKQHPLVGEAVVVGDRRPYLVALIFLDPDAAAGYAAREGIEGPLPKAAPLLEEVGRAVEQVNQTRARVAQIRRFRVLAEPLSIERGELTGTLKVKRRVVEEHFAHVIDAMYGEVGG